MVNVRGAVVAVGCCALVALGICGNAAAASPGLELQANGHNLAAGAHVGVEVNFQLGLCWSNEAGWGTLKSNGGASDTITKIRESNAGSVCSEGSEGRVDTETGPVKSVKVTASGRATVGLAVVLDIYEGSKHCSYSFKKLSGTFGSPGLLYMHGEATGKLVSSGSSTGCAGTRTTNWWWVSVDGYNAKNEPYATESELIG